MRFIKGAPLNAYLAGFTTASLPTTLTWRPCWPRRRRKGLRFDIEGVCAMEDRQTAAAVGPNGAGALPSVALALQGGGSHGAFTWGVLDRLLEEEAFYFEGICGTSAGAANAVVLADGFAAG